MTSFLSRQAQRLANRARLTTTRHKDTHPSPCRHPLSTATKVKAALQTRSNINWLKPSLLAASVSSVFIFAAHMSTHSPAHCQPSKPELKLLSAEAVQQHPLLRTGFPLYSQFTPDLLDSGIRHVLGTLDQQLTQLENTVSQPSFTPTWSNLFQSITDMTESLSYHYGLVSHLERVKDSEGLRKVVKELEPLKVAFSLRFSQSRPLYKAMLSLKSNVVEWSKLDAVQKRIVELTVLDAKLAGVGLEDDRKQRFNTIKQELESLSTQFRNNVADATKAFKRVIHDADELDGVPQTAMQQFKAAFEKDESIEKKAGATGYLVGISQVDFIPIMTYCSNRSLREEIYFAYNQRASSGSSDNTPIMSKILLLRHELAGLLDFKNYGELSLATKLVKSVARVDEFLEELRRVSYEAAVKDLAELRQFAKQQGCDYELMHWDITYWAEKLREHRFQYSEEELRKYFQFPIVLEGLFDLLKKLYGVSVVKSQKQVDVWHDDVSYYEVYDESGEEIAGFYIDPYSRPSEKTGGAWMDVVKQRYVILQADGSTKRQLPVAYLICNSTPPVDGKPSLMTFDEVNTLFHEMGHVTQHILTRVNYALASGIANVEWDAVELPSQYNENWLYHQPVIQKLSKHIDNASVLPDELYTKLYTAKQYRFGSDQLRQIHFAATDMSLHTKLLYHDPKQQLTGSVDYEAIGRAAFAMEQQIARKTAVLPPLSENRFLCGFLHIFAGGYASGYYSYKWAEVMSADAFAAFEEVGLDNEDKVREVAKRFRETVLALGGSEGAAEIYKKFRGREPTVDALLKQGGLLKEEKQQIATTVRL